MGNYEDLKVTVKALDTLLKPKQPPPIPKKILNKSLKDVAGLLTTLGGYFPPSAQDKRDAKTHPISQRIVNFMTLDPLRKKVFDKTYFTKAFRDLPTDRKFVIPTTPGTGPAFRDATLLYLYMKGRKDNHKALKEFEVKIKADYRNDPAVKLETEARELFRRLLSMDDPKKVARILTKEFPADKDTKAFAKAIKMNVPPQSKAKNAVKKTVHERLAEKIYKDGGYGRV